MERAFSIAVFGREILHKSGWSFEGVNCKIRFMKKKTIVLIVIGTLFLIAAWFGAEKLSGLRNHYKDLDFFTLWLGGRLAAQGQNMYDETIWISAHALYGSTWVENPFFVYPYPAALLFIPLGVLPIEIASTIWIFLSICMIVLSIVFLLSTWRSNRKDVFLVPLLAGTVIYRPGFLTVLHGQLDGLLFFILSLAVYCCSKGKQRAVCFLLPVLLIKPNLGGPILVVYALWLLLHHHWEAISHLIIESLGILLIPLMFFPGWIHEFIQSSLYKSEDQNLFPNLRGLAGLVCGEKAACFNPVWGIISLLLLSGLLFWMLRQKERLTSSSILALGIVITLLVTPYLRAYDLILLLIPVIMCLGQVSEGKTGFTKVTVLYLCFSLFSLGLLFLATMLGHDIYSVFLTVGVLFFLVWTILKPPAQELTL